MNKSQLINKISIDAKISKVVAGRVLASIIDSVTTSLKKGNDVTLIGFGTFTIRERSARTGRNPKNGKEIMISASKIPSFRAGKWLKNAIN